MKNKMVIIFIIFSVLIINSCAMINTTQTKYSTNFNNNDATTKKNKNSKTITKQYLNSSGEIIIEEVIHTYLADYPQETIIYGCEGNLLNKALNEKDFLKKIQLSILKGLNPNESDFQINLKDNKLLDCQNLNLNNENYFFVQVLKNKYNKNLLKNNNNISNENIYFSNFLNTYSKGKTFYFANITIKDSNNNSLTEQNYLSINKNNKFSLNTRASLYNKKQQLIIDYFSQDNFKQITMYVYYNNKQVNKIISYYPLTNVIETKIYNEKHVLVEEYKNPLTINYATKN